MLLASGVTFHDSARTSDETARIRGRHRRIVTSSTAIGNAT